MTLGEIRLFAFGNPPNGWLPCDGRELGVQQNQALYSLIQTTYGGDGKKIFKIPDLRGVTPVHQNVDKKNTEKMPVGTVGGSRVVALGHMQMPAHSHAFNASAAAASVPAPRANVLASKATQGAAAAQHAIFAEGATNMVALDVSTLSSFGGNAPHENMQPYTALQFCIATKGDYPPRPNP